MLKDKVTFVKKLPTYIKDLSVIFANPSLLENGRADNRLRFRPREHLVLAILCALQNTQDSGPKLRISSDPEGYDGILTDMEEGKQRNFGLEQTFVSDKTRGELNDEIIERIKAKEANGKEYAKNRNLIVLINKNGEIDPRRLKEAVSNFQNFLSYWIIYKEPNKALPTYIVVQIKSKLEKERMFRVILNPRNGRHSSEYLGLFYE